MTSYTTMITLKYLSVLITEVVYVKPHRHLKLAFLTKCYPLRDIFSFENETHKGCQDIPHQKIIEDIP